MSDTSVSDFRVEKDSMGEVRVPASAYYGVQTQRAVDNFSMISGLRSHPAIIESFVQLKLGDRHRQHRTGHRRSHERGVAIQQACSRILDDMPGWRCQFVVDAFQAGRRHQPAHEHQRGAGQPGAGSPGGPSAANTNG